MRSRKALRSRISSCHIYQLRLGSKFGILELWSWWDCVSSGATVVRCAGHRAAATAAKMALSASAASPARLLASAEASLFFNTVFILHLLLSLLSLISHLCICLGILFYAITHRCYQILICIKLESAVATIHCSDGPF